MAALARVVLTRREHVVMLEAFAKGFSRDASLSYEIRDEKPYFEDIPDSSFQ